MDSQEDNFLDTFFEDHPAVKFVRLQWVDYSGVLRTRGITKGRCMDLFNGIETYSLAQNCMVIPVSTAPRCSPDGIEQWELVPDWTSLRVCAFAPESASVMCFVAHRGLDNPFERCPRKLLSEMLRDLQSLDGISGFFLMGFEIEIVLLDETFDIARSKLDRTVAYSMTTGMSILEEIVAKLEEVSDIPVHHFHTEIKDQFEIALRPTAPLQAIDQLMMAQETIRSVARSHNLRATTSPNPVSGGPLSGLHAHLSLLPKEYSDSFLAGALRKVRPLCAFGLATYESYRRVVGDCAGEWVGWGTRNKDLPICKVDTNRWEFRFLDATANVYLFTAALIVAGMAGVRKRQQPASVDCNVAIPHGLEPQALQEWLRGYGITEHLPETLSRALDAANADDELQEWVGRELFKRYVKVKQAEVEAFGKMTPDERRRKLMEYF